MGRTFALHAAILLGVAVLPVAAGDGVEKAPDPTAGLKSVFEWKSAGGVVCWWRAPRDYDTEKGVNLTLILHGSNLTHQWGFANHPSETFRPDDFVLCPDGTTANGQGFNFLKEDTKKVHDLIEELKKSVKVRATFLYGHSQGSFFALQYAGDFPEEVTGVVAHASGIWNSSRTGKHGFHQAIVLMHGTQDPVVPYGQSIGGLEALRNAGYPIVRLRSLEWWNHWPAEVNGPVPHTSQQLAWVEGMTTTDPGRLAVCFDTLAKVPADGAGEHDFAGAWSLAGRIAGRDGVPEDLRARAAKTRSRVEELVRAHVESMGVPEKIVFEGKPWVGHLPVFLRAFDGIPVCDDLEKKLRADLERHQKEAVAHLRKYGPALEKQKVAEAFDEGMAAIESGFLYRECWNLDFRKKLKEWHADAKKWKLSKGALKTYDAMFDAFETALVDGGKAFETVNREHGIE